MHTNIATILLGMGMALTAIPGCIGSPYEGSSSTDEPLGDDNMLADGGVDSEDKALNATMAKRAIVSCYAKLAAEAYDDAIGLVGNGTAETSQDTRNGMGRWIPATNQSPTNGNIIKYYERSSGKRRELTISLKGSVSAGDWLRDGQSQVFFAQSPRGNDISDLSHIPTVGTSIKFESGFHNRVLNLAPEVADRLEALEKWRSQEAGREIGIKVVGHSLGAASAEIMALYIHDRYYGDAAADTEVFAFNAPLVANKSMADTYRNAATSCDFNAHVFNNSQDIVSSTPVGAHSVYSHTDDNDAYSRADCRYFGVFNSRGAGSASVSIPFFGPIGSILSRVGTFAVSRHDVNQWILPNGGIRLSPEGVTRNWFPVDPIGGVNVNTPQPAKRGIVGAFKASLFAARYSKYMTATSGGGGSLAFSATSASTWEKFRLLPHDSDCVKDGASITISPSLLSLYYVGVQDGNIRASTLGDPDANNVFLVINHTAKVRCVASGDIISLWSAEGRYVSAEADGTAKASRVAVDPSERFTVGNVTEIKALKDLHDVTFTTAGNYGGSQIVAAPGEFNLSSTSSSRRLSASPIWSNNIESMTIPDNTIVIGWSKPNAGGKRFGPFFGPAVLPKVPGGNDWEGVSISAVSWDNGPPNTSYMTIFKDPGANYTSESHVVGTGDFPNLSALPGTDGRDWRNDIESVTIPPGAVVTGYDLENYGGERFGPYHGGRTLGQILGANRWSSMKLRGLRTGETPTTFTPPDCDYNPCIGR